MPLPRLTGGHRNLPILQESHPLMGRDIAARTTRVIVRANDNRDANLFQRFFGLVMGVDKVAKLTLASLG